MGEGEQENKPESLVESGEVVGAQGALSLLIKAEQDLVELLHQHVIRDWGDLDDEDKKENELSVKEGFRILSAYSLETDVKVWIIKEGDRSVTTILLPGEY